MFFTTNPLWRVPPKGYIHLIFRELNRSGRYIQRAGTICTVPFYVAKVFEIFSGSLGFMKPIYRTGLPSDHSSFKMGRRGTRGSHTYPSAGCLSSLIAVLLAGMKGWMEIIQELQCSHQPAGSLHEQRCFSKSSRNLTLWMIIIILVRNRIIAHELAMLLGIVSHSFQVVPGVEASLCRGRRAICHVRSSLSSSCLRANFPRDHQCV